MKKKMILLILETLVAAATVVDADAAMIEAESDTDEFVVNVAEAEFLDKYPFDRVHHYRAWFLKNQDHLYRG